MGAASGELRIERSTHCSTVLQGLLVHGAHAAHMVLHDLLVHGAHAVHMVLQGLLVHGRGVLEGMVFHATHLVCGSSHRDCSVEGHGSTAVWRPMAALQCGTSWVMAPPTTLLRHPPPPYSGNWFGC